jgi:hypothetical protein
MNPGFIAALLVMMIMTAFIFVILRTLAVHTGNKIRDHVVVQLQSYDVLLQKKETELKNLQKQIDQEKEKLSEDTINQNEYEEAPGGVIVTADARYRSNDFFLDYRYMKEQFVFNRREIISEIHANVIKQNSSDIILLLDDLLEKFNLDNVYKLSELSKIEQLEVIRDILTQKEKAYLEDYIKQTKEFNCLTFYQWLSMQRILNDRDILVKTAERNENFNDSGNNIHTQYDQSLCEGFQVFVGNKMYDYGIRKCVLI